jgi:3D (Asp-Asp-Asp) domain-containing protein
MRVPVRQVCCALAVIALAEGCAGRLHPQPPAAKPSATRLPPFTATAYCTGRLTATGTKPAESIVAADPRVLPMGSRIRLSGLDNRYNRVYVVGDTGGSIRGRRIDLYMRNCKEATAFGRRTVTISVLR